MTNDTTNDTTHSHGPRMFLHQLAPEVNKAMYALHKAATKDLDPSLVELVQIRSSQLNHCAFCLDMHTKDARKAGETEERIYLLNAWREAGDFYTGKERAALALTEAVTLITGGVPDEVYDEAARHFGDEELARLISLIVTINSWNRIAVSTRLAPGAYEVR